MDPTTLLFSSKNALMWMDPGNDGSLAELFRRGQITADTPPNQVNDFMDNIGQLFLPILVARESLASMRPSAILKIIAGRRFSVVIQDSYNSVILVVGSRGHVFLTHYANIVASILDFLCGPFEKLMEHQLTLLRTLLQQWRDASIQNMTMLLGGIPQPLQSHLNQVNAKKLIHELSLPKTLVEVLLLRKDQVQVLMKSDSLTWVDSVHNFLIPLVLRSLPKDAALSAILRDRDRGHRIPAIIKRMDLHEDLTLLIIQNAMSVNHDLRTLTQMAHQVSVLLEESNAINFNETFARQCFESLQNYCRTFRSTRARALKEILQILQVEPLAHDRLHHLTTRFESQLSNCFSDVLASIPHQWEEPLNNDTLASLRRIMMAIPTTNLTPEAKRIHLDVTPSKSRYIFRDNHVITSLDHFSTAIIARGTDSPPKETPLDQNHSINVIQNKPNLIVLRLVPNGGTIYAWLEDQSSLRICPMSSQVRTQIIAHLKSLGGIITFCPVRMAVTDLVGHTTSVYHVQYLVEF